MRKLKEDVKLMAMKKTTKKTATKKVAVKAADKKVRAKKSAALSVKTPYTKSQLVGYLAETCDLKKKDVLLVLDGMLDVMTAHLSKKGPGEFNLAGLMKFRTIHKPATKARLGTNPFTGEQTTFAAKPARSVLKIRPLKKLKAITA